MITKIQKWGNSLALRIPRSFARETNLQAGSVVDLSVQSGQLVVDPVAKPKYSLEELLKGVTKNNIHTEIDTGEPLGDEAW